MHVSVDAYRNKVRSLVAPDVDLDVEAPHFETRVGKRRWTERMEKGKRRRTREGSPT